MFFGDPAIATAIFVVSVSIYLSFRFLECYGDSASLVWTINHAIGEGVRVAATPRHWFVEPVFQKWVCLMDRWSMGEIPLSHPLLTNFATSLNRIVTLNSILGAGTLTVTYLFLRRLGASIHACVTSLGIFGASTTVWMLATSAERQLPGLFLLSLGFYSVTFLSTAKNINFVISSLAASIFSFLTPLFYLPLVMFMPVILVLSAHQILAAPGREAGPRKKLLIVFASTFSMVCLFSILLLSLPVARIIQGVLIPVTSRDYFGFFPSMTSPGMFVTCVLSWSTFFSGWIPVNFVGMPRFDAEMIFSNKYGAGFFSFLLSFSAISFVYYQVFRSVAIFLRSKRLISDNHPLFYQFLFACYVLGSTFVLLGTREGIVAEMWALVLWGALPVVSLGLTRMATHVTRMVCPLLAFGLFAFNFFTGSPRFFSDFSVRNATALQFVKHTVQIMRKTGKDDIFLVHVHNPLYWLEEASYGQRQRYSLDSMSSDQVKKTIEAAFQKKGHVFVAQEILSPDVLSGKFSWKMHTPQFEELRNLLRNQFTPDGTNFKLSSELVFQEIKPHA